MIMISDDGSDADDDSDNHGSNSNEKHGSNSGERLCHSTYEDRYNELSVFYGDIYTYSWTEKKSLSWINIL